LFGNVRQELLAILSPKSANMTKNVTSELNMTVIGNILQQKWSENHATSSLVDGYKGFFI
jgi:hypothetical protein